MTLSFAALAVLALAFLSTAFLAGVFGMAGGMILMGVLLIYLPVPEAMMLHGVAQMTSNFWRGFLWRGYVEWAIVARYVLGLLAAAIVFSWIVFVPDRAIVLIVLGLIPLLAMSVPEKLAPKVDQRGGSEIAGFFSTSIQLISGVSGPLLDLFFVRTKLDRRRVVASKAVCQTITHLAKLLYFGSLVRVDALNLDFWLFGLAILLAIVGTSASRIFLEKLTDLQFRQWTRLIVLALGAICLVQGIVLSIDP